MLPGEARDCSAACLCVRECEDILVDAHLKCSYTSICSFCGGNSRPEGLHPLANCYIQPPCALLKMRAQLNGCDNGVDWSSFSHSWSPGFLNICGQTLHHLHRSAYSEGRRWEEARKIAHIVAFAPVLCSDLPLCFQFHIHMPDSSLGNPPFLCFSFIFLPLLCFSFCSFLTFPSAHPVLNSFFFQFWNTLKPEEARRCPPPVQNETLRLHVLFYPVRVSLYSFISLPTWSCISHCFPIFQATLFLLEKQVSWWGEVNLLWSTLLCLASPLSTSSVSKQAHKQ